MAQALRRALLALAITLGPGVAATLVTTSPAQAVTVTSIQTTADDDDDDDGGAPRGGVDTGVGGSVARDDDDDDDGGAPRGGVDTGVGGSVARDDDDDDDGGAPRGGVETGMGGTAGKGAVEDSTAVTGSAQSESARAGLDAVNVSNSRAGEPAGDDDSRSVPLVPLSLAGAALLGVGAYWVRRAFFAGS
ncbi:hypothetical protein HD597_010641 [Nonomuraea thailandensis]|uniref:Uncharacterized protein n=1 Tax=Nonomuraea thailandensis TaxID=1188745 RepID=A0A9X2GR23_9ACTN|nr:hypothetical protein [Nonomuraea thailandensis]MCP2363621.1 hypothetical protein [Nonomuraea thailandensis]